MTSATGKDSQSIGLHDGRHADVVRLRGKVWLSHALYLTGLSMGAFARRYYYGDERSKSGLVAKWCREEVNPCKQSALRIKSELPNTFASFNHPIFELLKNTPISANRVWMLLSVLQPPSVSGAKERRTKVDALWPLCELRRRRYRRKNRPLSSPLWLPPDSWQLRCQPSFDSLAKMIGLLRVVEDPHYVDKHAYWAQEVFRLLPASLQEPWLAPHLDAFVDLVEILRARVPGSTTDFFTVNRDILRKQIQWKGFRPLYRDGARALDPIRLESRGNESSIIPKADLSHVVELGLL